MSDGNNPTAQVVVPEPDDSDEYRPNRWTGAPSTWRSLTSQERGLAASLDKIRDSDLSVHLYNAFALKKRARDDVGLPYYLMCICLLTWTSGLNHSRG